MRDFEALVRQAPSLVVGDSPSSRALAQALQSPQTALAQFLLCSGEQAAGKQRLWANIRT